jgi:rare lipoprotein A
MVAAAPPPSARDTPIVVSTAATVPVVATVSSTPATLPAPPPTDVVPATPDTAVAAAATTAAAAPVADAPVARAYTTPARGFWVQLGAFRQREGAEGFQQRVATELDWLSPLLAVFSDASMFRLQAGPYPSRNDARAAAERIRDGLQLAPVIVERR